MLLNCGVAEDSWESLGLQGYPSSPSWRRSVLNVHWNDWHWRWNSNTLATWCEELTHWKRPSYWERLKAGGEAGNRGWGGWIASPALWTWVWVSYGSWWWTGNPGVLQSMGSQRVRQDWATELNWRVPGQQSPRFNNIPVLHVKQTALIWNQGCSLFTDWWWYQFEFLDYKLESQIVTFEISLMECTHCLETSSNWDSRYVMSCDFPVLFMSECWSKPIQFVNKFFESETKVKTFCKTPTFILVSSLIPRGPMYPWDVRLPHI